MARIISVLAIALAALLSLPVEGRAQTRDVGRESPADQPADPGPQPAGPGPAHQAAEPPSPAPTNHEGAGQGAVFGQVRRLAGNSLDVAFAEGMPMLTAGRPLPAGDVLALPEQGCVRLVASDQAALVLRGPGQVGRSTTTGAVLTVVSGQGVLHAGSQGASIRFAGHLLEVRNGAAAFDADPRGGAWLLSGQGRLDGEPLAISQQVPEPELAGPDLCLPARPTIVERLGDPVSVVAQVHTSQARNAGAGDDEASTAEGGATCIDSADSAAAADPSQGLDTGVDPDARRDPGRIRVIIRLPQVDQ